MSGILFSKGPVDLVASNMGGVETLHSSVNIPPSLLDAGQVVRWSACIKCNATAGSDTWQIRVRIGGLTGTALWAGNLVDASAHSTGYIDGFFSVVTKGTGDAIVTGAGSGYGAAIASVSGATLAQTGTQTDGDTSADYVLAVTSESSGTDAGEGFRVVFLRAWCEAGVGTVATPLP